MRKHLIAGMVMPVLLLMAVTDYAQTGSSGIKAVLTADSLASGNTKDVLTSFFQLALNRFTGKNKELNFSSNPFAVLLKSDPSLAIDTSYYKYRALRKLNFNFGLKLDTSYRFNGFSSGIKYALIDKRDSSTSKLLFERLSSDSLIDEADQLQRMLARLAPPVSDTARRRAFNRSMRSFMADKTVPFNKLDTGFQRIVKEFLSSTDEFPVITRSINSNPAFNIRTAELKRYDSLKNTIKNNLLWTVSATDTTYKDQFFFSNVVFKTQLLKGFGSSMKRGSNWEYDMQAALNLLDDTLHKGRDLKRTMLTIEPGFNLVLRTKRTDYSFMEFKFSGSYIRQFGSLYATERRDSLTVNATMRIRVIGDIWIPLEIKYDPRSGNIFGFLNIRMNFTTLGKQGGAKS